MALSSDLYGYTLELAALNTGAAAVERQSPVALQGHNRTPLDVTRVHQSSPHIRYKIPRPD